MFVVIENTPGYVPEDDDPATFEDLGAAQEYLRERVESYVEHVVEGEDVEPNVTVDERSAYVVSNVREHDLGRVFEIIEEEGGE